MLETYKVMTDPLADKIGINVQGGTVNVQNLNIGIAERLAQSGDRVRILVVAANPLGSSPLKLDHEVKTIQEALRRSRKRDDFVVEYRLAATPSELRRALLDVEPHVLHFSGHGAGEKGLLFVSDESAGAIYRSDTGEVRSRSTDSNEIKFVPAQPLANLLQLCEDHLECVVLNACYSDVQGNAISANIPFTIGMRDVVDDNVAIKFSQGFYDAIGAGKGYESAFKWGKAAIGFDLANEESSNILVLRKKGGADHQIEQPINKPPNTSNQQSKRLSQSAPIQPSFIIWSIAFITIGLISGVGFILSQFTKSINPTPNISSSFPTFTPSSILSSPSPPITSSPSPKPTVPSKTAEDLFDDGFEKYNKKDYPGAIADYNEAIRLKPDYAFAYNNRGLAKYDLGNKQEAIADYNEAIRLKPDYAFAYNNRGLAKYDLGDKKGAIADYNEAIRLKPDYAFAYHNRGLAKYDLGDKQEAIADYNQAIRLNPNYDRAYHNRGNAKSALGDKQGAIADYNEAIRLNPNHANSYYSRGLIKKERGDKQEALADFRKASELYQQQGNTEWYNNSRDRIRELGG